jgi:hypothetical protein
MIAAAPLVLAIALYLAPVAALMLIGLTLIYGGLALLVWFGSLGGLLGPLTGFAVAPTLIGGGITCLCLGGMVTGFARAVRPKQEF